MATGCADGFTYAIVLVLRNPKRPAHLNLHERFIPESGRQHGQKLMMADHRPLQQIDDRHSDQTGAMADMAMFSIKIILIVDRCAQRAVPVLHNRFLASEPSRPFQHTITDRYEWIMHTTKPQKERRPRLSVRAANHHREELHVNRSCHTTKKAEPTPWYDRCATNHRPSQEGSMESTTVTTLNVVQQVLRGFALSFAVAHKTDLHQFAICSNRFPLLMVWIRLPKHP